MVNHKSYPLRPLDNTFGTTIAELARQGWTTRGLAWLEFGAPTPIGIGIRRVGDSSSATIPITPKLTLPHATPDYVTQHAKFEVINRTVQPRSGRRGRKIHGTRELRLQVEVLSSLALHYRYTTRQSDAANSWSYFVGKRLNRWIKIELYKTPHNKRPFEITPYTEDAYLNLDPSPNILLPETWDYADDQMPAWYEEFLEDSKVDHDQLY